MKFHRSEAGMSVLADLNPPLVWRLFQAISRIPRCSKKEQKIRAWIKDWAKQRSIPCKSDAAGNLLLRRRAAPGRERIPMLVLQAHLDMVCVKADGVQMNFDTDPIPILVDGSRVRAEGTTLGADNGIGVAYCLAALIDPELLCGPLEVLLTVDEEEGGTGALGLKAGFFSGRYLLNLDSEEEGIITIGTAGLEITDCTLPIRTRKRAASTALSLVIRGLAGGHSGMDIHLPRLNAIKLAVEALNRLRAVMPVCLGRFDGGEAANSIPSHSACIILVPGQSVERAVDLLERWRKETLDRSGDSEPGLNIAVEHDSGKCAYSIEETDTICRLLTEIPHGPLAFSRDIEGLVESSVNLARIRSKQDSIEVTVSYRSSVESTLDELGTTMKRIGECHGAKVRQHSRAPAWTANPASAFSKLVQKHYSNALGRSAELKAFHAGLECGIFTALAPELQMASIGPDIHAVHTPDEHVDIPSVALLWDVLRRIIEGMPELEETQG
jgi:dipeptidase D